MSTPEEYQSKGKKNTNFFIIETVTLPKESMKLEPIDIQENAKNYEPKQEITYQNTSSKKITD
jgi:hypothetical protein